MQLYRFRFDLRKNNQIPPRRVLIRFDVGLVEQLPARLYFSFGNRMAVVKRFRAGGAFAGQNLHRLSALESLICDAIFGAVLRAFYPIPARTRQRRHLCAKDVIFSRICVMLLLTEDRTFIL